MADEVRWNAPIEGSFGVGVDGAGLFSVRKLEVTLTAGMAVKGRPTRFKLVVREDDAGGWRPAHHRPPEVTDVATESRVRYPSRAWDHRDWYPKKALDQAVRAIRVGWADHARANPEVVCRIWRQWWAYRLLEPRREIEYLADLIARKREECDLFEQLINDEDPRRKYRELRARFKKLFPGAEV